MATALAAPEGALRVAAVWGTTVVELQTLRRGQSFQIDDKGLGACAMPEGLEMARTPLFFARGGWELDAKGALAGTLRLRGRDEDPAALAKSGAPIAVVPGDFGLLQYGLFSIFFQYTTVPAQMSVGIPIELLVILALFSSAVMHMSTLGILRLTMTPDPLPKPLELTNPDELAARFGLHRAELEVPPPPTPGDKAGSGVKDPGAKDPKAAGGGKKIAGAEGKLGLQGKENKTELQGAPQPAPNLGGLSDVLNSDTGDEIKHTLQTINSVANALNGLNSQNIVLGIGSGTGLKGGGGGGGGTGPGVAYGAGTLDTGWGAGTGGGYGGGTGGPGAAGAGGNGKGGKGGGDGSGSGPKESRLAFGGQSVGTPGGLSDEQIRRVVRAHVGALQACYEGEAQRNPNLRGGVTSSWTIDPTGSVTSASLSGSTLNNPRVEGCVLRQIRGWHFPAADRPSTVASWPFRFGVGG